MFLESCAVAIAGVLAGGVINILADDLPARRPLRLPRYADGRRRPSFAWLGIGAFMFNLRSPPEPDAAELGRGTPASAPGNALLSWRYPLTEIATAVLALLLYADIQDEAALLSTMTFFRFAYATLFVLISLIDLEHKRIPFPLAFSLGALALIDAIFLSGSAPGPLSAVMGGLIGFGVFYAVYLGGVLFARILSRTRDEPLDGSAFGFGDVVLMAAVGLTVGFPSIFLAIACSVFGGAGGAVVVIFARLMKMGGYQPFDKIAYGPFIVGSAVTVMLIGN